MKIEDNRKDEEIRCLKDIEVGECFKDFLGGIIMKTDEEFNGDVRVLDLKKGILLSYRADTMVKTINAKVVIE